MDERINRFWGVPHRNQFAKELQHGRRPIWNYGNLLWATVFYSSS